MAERKKYPGGLVRNVGIPNISFAQYQEMSNMARTMENKLNSVVAFATKE